MRARGSDRPDDGPDEGREPRAKGRRWGRGGRSDDVVEEPEVSGEELGWIADLRTAKEQRSDLGPGGADGPAPAEPTARPRRARPDEPTTSAPPVGYPPEPELGRVPPGTPARSAAPPGTPARSAAPPGAPVAPAPMVHTRAPETTGQAGPVPVAAGDDRPGRRAAMPQEREAERPEGGPVSGRFPAIADPPVAPVVPRSGNAPAPVIGPAPSAGLDQPPAGPAGASDPGAQHAPGRRGGWIPRPGRGRAAPSRGVPTEAYGPGDRPGTPLGGERHEGGPFPDGVPRSGPAGRAAPIPPVGSSWRRRRPAEPVPRTRGPGPCQCRPVPRSRLTAHPDGRSRGGPPSHRQPVSLG